MNMGYGVAALGVLGLVIGGAMYAADWHRTIGLGGVGVGVILLIAGFWMSRSAKKAPAMSAGPTQPGPT